MEQLPILVEDLAIRDLSNAVCVATCKFTNDQFAAAPDQGAMKQARLAIYPEYRTLIYLLNAFCATSDEPERYAALIRALNDNIDYTRRHAMRRKQKSDEPQPDGGGTDGGDSDVTPVTPEA